MAYPTLSQNAVYSSLYNQVVGITVEGRPIASTQSKLLDQMRLDVAKYGDTKLIIETDILESAPFVQDSVTNCNVLAVNRGPAPYCKPLQIKQARQIMVTTDSFGISSMAFGSEGTLSAFIGAVEAWVAKTKEVYEAGIFNTFLGSSVASGAAQNITVTVGSGESLAQRVGAEIDELLVKLAFPSRKYNDQGFMRSFDKSDLVLVWNEKYLKEIRKIDLPALFHDGLVDPEVSFVMPSEYFGAANAADVAAASNTGGYTSLVETDYTVGGNTVHVMPGEEIPSGVKILKGEGLLQDDYVICKIIAKGSLPFLTGVSSSTEFVNGRNNSRNLYLTWVFDYDRIPTKPLITMKLAH